VGDRARSRHTAYVGLGSNLGPRARTLRAALRELSEHPAIELTRVSRFHETDPVGGPPQGRFVNAVAELSTTLSARELLEVLHRVEHRFGRERSVRWGPRTLDLDLLLHGEATVRDGNCEVPHPRMHLRRFVLEPLCEIAPGARHPGLGRTAVEMLQALCGRPAGESGADGEAGGRGAKGRKETGS
jgi:2-amino-4-hydroxy-6-hydroxymethyldihydropteridine diphosphokinase